ncbi:MAG: DUF4129 domain-containing protein [Prevotella sp.]|nr:DUF4129 domain-containing protein [Prevotella sp.]
MDTLSCDTTLLSLMRNNGAYDYNRELVTPQVSLWDWVMQKLEEFLGRIFGEVTGHHLTLPLVIMAGLALLGLILWFLYKYRPELFFKNKKNRFAEEEEGETIYGIDFEAEIKRAVSRGDYPGAVRWVYLQTLRYLSDTHQIDWQLYKTPTQYVYECRESAFRELTNHFLRVRYGHFEADASLFNEMNRLQETLKQKIVVPTVTTEEGGEA